MKIKCKGFLYLSLIMTLNFLTLMSFPSLANPLNDRLHQLGNGLIARIQILENCANPVSPYLDKIYSNLKYRSNRLKKCIEMAKIGDLRFDCHREFRKTYRSHEDQCKKEMESVKSVFKEFQKEIANKNSQIKRK